MVTIILSHPWHGSFNKTILDTVINKLNKQKQKYQIIDLHKDGFDPTFTESDLSVYRNGQYKDPLVGKYQEILKNTNELILIFPIWWGNMPAMLKGFIDKTFLSGFAFSYENGWTPLLTNIKKAMFITTSQQPTEVYKEIMEYNLNSILKPVGIGNIEWLNCDQISSGSKEHREKFLEKISLNTL